MVTVRLKPAHERTELGQGVVMPRTRVKRLKAKRGHEVRPRAGRVNQKMIDRMIALRGQGFSHVAIGKRLGCSERTVRRHTQGVSPRLVHASDPKRIDLLAWCAVNIFAAKDRLKLNVQETDVAMKKAREGVSKLDPLTKQRLERDREMRIDFLFNVALPSAAPEIRSMRFI